MEHIVGPPLSGDRGLAPHLPVKWGCNDATFRNDAEAPLWDFWLAVYTAGSALGSQAWSLPALSRFQAAAGVPV